MQKASTRSEEVKKVGRTEATKEAILLLELATARSRASGLTDEETKARIRAALEKAKQEILRLEEPGDDRAGLGLVLGGRSTTDTERPKAQGQTADQINGQRESDLLREA